MEQPKIKVIYESQQKDFDIPEEIWEEIAKSKEDIAKGNFIKSEDFEKHFCK